MKKFIKINFVLVLFLVCFMPLKSFAADIFLTSDKNMFTLGEEFLVQVFVDTKDFNVNALEGSVIFPPELLELKEVREGNSSINFWIERPHLATDGTIYFSGITIGGFSGNKRLLFGTVFKSKALGADDISVSNIQVLLNDGAGTKVATSVMPFSFSITEGGDGTSPQNLKIIDTEPPEGFTPLIARDPTIFDGKYFLVFSTVDKGSGIDHYEVREGIWSDYVVAESPYLLKDQSLGKDIIVKAVDKAGNKRLVKIKAQNPNHRLEEVLIIVIILAICIALFKKKWPKRTS